MTVRLKTVLYAFPTMVTSNPTATWVDLATITVRVPETTSRTIRSAVLRIAYHHNQTGASNNTGRGIGIGIDAVAADDVNVAGTLANTGDHSCGLIQRDVTSYFVTNFTGTSHDVTARFRSNGCATINISCELLLTYEWDDALDVTFGLANLKTVEIPLESPAGSLSTTLAEIGTNQVPLLDTFLPEAGKIIRDIYFRIDTNIATTTNVPTALGLALDAEAEQASGLYNEGVITSYALRYIWKRADMDTSSAHAFMARSTAVASRFEHLSIVMVVTYEFSPASTTRTMVSAKVPITTIAALPGPSSAEAYQKQLALAIADPGTITLVQSGIIFWHSLSDTTPGSNWVRVGAQSFKEYARQAFTDTAGGNPFAHRIDAGGSAGAALTLARGENTFALEAYNDQVTGANGTSIPQIFGGMLYLNYTCDVASTGVGANTHTVEINLMDNQISQVLSTVTVDPTIPEASYRLVNVGLECWIWTSSSPAFSWFSQLAPAVNRELASCAMASLESNASRMTIDASQHFYRWAGDPEAGRYQFNESRAWSSLIAATNGFPVATLLFTYCPIAFSHEISLSDYAGDGSGVTVDVFRSDTRELVATVTTDIGGTATAMVYDDTVTYFAAAQQDATHVGRSTNEVPT